jgi:hypothetical protein
LIALLVPAVAECQSDAGQWRFVHPKAKALIGINWQRIRQSPAVALLRDRWLNAQSMGDFPGIELLDEVDRVVISAPGAQNDAQESALLIAVYGHFDAAEVRRLFAHLGAKAQSYNSFEVYRPQGAGAKDFAWVLVDPGTILCGDPPSIFAALDRSRFPATMPEPGSAAARAPDLDSTYDLWMILSGPDAMANDRLANLLRGSEWIPDAQGIEAGINFRSGLAADVTLHLASDSAAKHAVIELGHLLAAASKDHSVEPQNRELIKKLKFSSEGAAAKISLRLNPEELQTTAQAFAAAHPVAVVAVKSPDPAGAIPVASSAGPAFAAKPTLAAKPPMIRIEGLDEGPIEIPYQDH